MGYGGSRLESAAELRSTSNDCPGTNHRSFLRSVLEFVFAGLLCCFVAMDLLVGRAVVRIVKHDGWSMLPQWVSTYFAPLEFRLVSGNLEPATRGGPWTAIIFLLYLAILVVGTCYLLQVNLRAVRRRSGHSDRSQVSIWPQVPSI